MESSRAFRAIIAVLGSMAVEGSVITWVADHRKHHAFTDQEGDPHSPHLSGPGFWGAVKGLWHAHVGWLFETVGTAERERFAADLVKDHVVRVVDKLFWLWVVLGFAIPFALGWIVGGGLGTALAELLRDPQTKQLVAAGDGLEFQVFVDGKFLFEGLFTLVESGHDFGSPNRCPEPPRAASLR